MSIRPIMPSFKGYIEVYAKAADDKWQKKYTFNTNSIAFAPKSSSFGKDCNSCSNIFYGDKVYLTECSYSDLQKACILAEKNNNTIIILTEDGSIKPKSYTHYRKKT